MSFSYERYDKRFENRSRRSALGYWVPLAITVGVATAGLAAWAWSERKDGSSSTSSSSSSDNDDDEHLSYGEEHENLIKKRKSQSQSQSQSQSRSQSQSYSQREVRGSGESLQTQDEEGIVARMSGAIRRTPSPQQLIDGASRRVAAGVAAAGAMVGGALTSIREEGGHGGNDHFGDHSRWSEEAEIKGKVDARAAESASAVAEQTQAFSASLHASDSRTSDAGQSRSLVGQGSRGKKKTVAVVLSTEASRDDHEMGSGSFKTEQASLLSHLASVNHDTTNLLILIYAPHLKSHPSSPGHPASNSLGSSYTAISSPMPTPGEELVAIEPEPFAEENRMSSSPPAKDASASTLAFMAIRNQALDLVSSPTHIMPFSTPTGHVHMLRHLAPSLIYMAESLSGERGENVEAIKGWVGQVVVVVGADDGGMGGLVDTEDEEDGGADTGKKGQKWWENSAMTGLGMGLDVVETFKVREDWERRVLGRD